MIKKDTKTSLLILGAISFTTLIISPDLNDPFNIPKLFGLFVFSILGILILPKFSHLLQIYKQNIAFWISLMFILLMLLRSIFTDHFFTGFFGRYGRNSGWLVYLCYFIFFILAATFTNFRLIRNSLIMISALGLILTIYGFMQYNDIDFIAYAHSGYPIITTLGNSNFTSSFIGISAISTFYFFFIEKSILKKSFLLSVIVIELLLIFLSKSSQGLFVATIGIISFTLLKIFLYSRKKFLLFSPLIFGISITAFLGFFKIGPLKSLIYQPSVSYRGDYFRAAKDMFLDNPWFGVGIDRYGENFRIYRDLDAAFRLDPSTTTNWAHNQILQFFATGGVSLGIVYVMFVGVVTYAGIRHIKKLESANQNIAVVIFSVWIGYLAQSQISIDQISITLVGWIFAGFIVGVKIDSSESTKTIPVLYKSKRVFSQRIWLVLLLAMSFIPLRSLWTADHDIKLARSGVIPNNFENSYGFAVSIIDRSPYLINYRLIAADLLASNGEYKDSEKILLEAIKIDEKSYDSLSYLARLYELTGNISGSVMIREKLLNLDRYDVENYIQLSKNYLVIGEQSKYQSLIDQLNRIGVDAKYINQLSNLN